MAAEAGFDAPLRLLVVEDNPDDVELIRLKLEGVATDRRFVIEAVDRVSAALRRLKGTDVVLLDLGLPDAGGIDAVSRLSNEAPEIPIVVLTGRSEEHTSELQSPCNLVCRLLLEKKKTLKT